MTTVNPQLFAHSVPGSEDKTRWERLSEHLRNVAEAAESFAAPFEAGGQARAAGLLHDIGKCSAAYQRYIATPGANRGPARARGSELLSNRRRVAVVRRAPHVRMDRNI